MDWIPHTDVDDEMTGIDYHVDMDRNRMEFMKLVNASDHVRLLLFWAMIRKKPEEQWKCVIVLQKIQSASTIILDFRAEALQKYMSKTSRPDSIPHVERMERFGRYIIGAMCVAIRSVYRRITVLLQFDIHTTDIANYLPPKPISYNVRYLLVHRIPPRNKEFPMFPLNDEDDEYADDSSVINIGNIDVWMRGDYIPTGNEAEDEITRQEYVDRTTKNLFVRFLHDEKSASLIASAGPYHRRLSMFVYVKGWGLDRAFLIPCEVPDHDGGGIVDIVGHWRESSYDRVEPHFINTENAPFWTPEDLDEDENTMAYLKI